MGLRDEALQFALDLTDDELRGEDAIDVLVERVDNYVFAFKEEEASAVFRAGTRIGGPMSRQPSECTNDVVHHTPLEVDEPSHVPRRVHHGVQQSLGRPLA